MRTTTKHIIKKVLNHKIKDFLNFIKSGGVTEWIGNFPARSFTSVRI